MEPSCADPTHTLLRYSICELSSVSTNDRVDLKLFTASSIFCKAFNCNRHSFVRMQQVRIKCTYPFGGLPLVAQLGQTQLRAAQQVENLLFHLTQLIQTISQGWSDARCVRSPWRSRWDRHRLFIVLYSRKLGDQTGQKTTVLNAKDMCGPDRATQNIVY